MKPAQRVALGVLCAAVVSFVVAAPLLGSPRVVRLPAVVVPALALALLVMRPWRDPDWSRRLSGWQPSRRLLCIAAGVVGTFLFWYVLTRFRSGEINAVDFTVYYDRPCFQTVQGRPLFVEVSDTPGLSRRSELGDHAYWAMLLVCRLYTLHSTPLWLHALSALALTVGAVHVFRILFRLGAGAPLAAASGLAFVFNDNTARVLNYGFHPEVLYAWFVPWMIDAGLRGARGPYLAAALACTLVKEDACLPVFAAAVALALNRGRAMSWADRVVFLVVPTALAVANLAAFYAVVVPMLTGHDRPAYAHFWGNYGETPWLALLGMLSEPWRVAAGVATSGIVRVLLPHLFLPLIGWRWTVGVLPLVAIYAASANEQVSAFAIYYAAPLIPFLAIGGAWGALALARRLTAKPERAQAVASAAVLLGAVLVGAGHRGYSLRPWKGELAAVPVALTRLADEPVVLIQSGLFTHAGYDERFRLLTPETLYDPGNRGAVVLLAPGVAAYPFRGRELAQGLAGFEAIGPMPAGIMAIRLPGSVQGLNLPTREKWRRRGRRSCEAPAGGSHRPQVPPVAEGPRHGPTWPH